MYLQISTESRTTKYIKLSLLAHGKDSTLRYYIMLKTQNRNCPEGKEIMRQNSHPDNS
jgi:hypothetical protein